VKHEPNLMSIQRTSTFRLDPSLTGQEAIVLRALAAGESDRQVCRELHTDPATFLRMMRDMREKIGMANNERKRGLVPVLVPEPGSLSLLLLGLAAVGFLARRRGDLPTAA
jgi:DNA-binding CsgD family transcriptional regulator